MENTHILFITDAWGPLYGGVNSFNYDLTTALSEIISEDYIIACTCRNPSEQSKVEAAKLGIKLIQINSDLDSPEVIVVDILKEKMNISHVFCHDYISGQIGLNLIEIDDSLKDKLFSFHHMNPEAYDSLKTNFNSVNSDAKNKLQTRLFETSIKVYCIGPKLRDSAIDRLGTKTKVVELIPGLAQAKSQNRPKSYFKASIIGRISKEIDKVKQYDLALAACAQVDSMNHLKPDSVISLIGVNESETEKIIKHGKKIFKKHKAKSLKINPIHYLTSRKELFDKIKRQSVAFMLSAHEGFGLVGWEAIAAEVPLIIGENTGLYQLLKERFGGFGIGNVLPVDIRSNIYEKESFSEEELTSVTNSLLKYLKNEELYKKNAQILKHYLAISFSWENCAYDLAESANIETKPKKFDLQKFSLPLLNILNIVKGINKRNIQYDILEDFLRRNAFENWLILFGGVSSTLCNDNFANTYLNWLRQNNKAVLFICYENENSLRYRLHKLNKENLVNSEKANIKIEEKVSIKLKEIEQLKEYLNKKSIVSDRIKFIEISTPLYFYSIIGDCEIIYTPLLDKRSSDTFSLHIDDSHLEIKKDIVNSIVNVLTKEKNVPKEFKETLSNLSLSLEEIESKKK